MYCHSYGDRDRAVAKFRRIPVRLREQMAKTDYSMAEKRCPQKMAIGKLMKTALQVLS
jgi:hypothetical protein